MEDSIMLVAGGTKGESINSNNNKKRSLHRRSQSNDSADSSKEGCSKTGTNVRRKLQWSMKELLSSTSLLTIESSSVKSAEDTRTCATEATIHSIVSAQGKYHPTKNTTKRNKVAPEKDVANKRFTKISLKRSPPRKVTIRNSATDSVLQPPHRACKPARSQRKLIPRISQVALLERKSTRCLQVEEHKQPVAVKHPVSSPVSPLATSSRMITGGILGSCSSSNSASTTLTPISPMWLSFEYLGESQDSVDSNSKPINADKTELATMEDDEESLLLRDSFSNDNIAFVLCLKDTQLDKTASPLTPSPTLNSPPVKRTQKPRPFVLERILSERNCCKRMRTDDQDIKDDSSRQFFDSCTPAGESTTACGSQSASKEDEGQVVSQKSEFQPIQSTVASLNNGSEGLRPVDSEQHGTNFCDQKRILQQQLSARARPLLEKDSSTQSIRTRKKSVPVDVDDAKFVDIANNLQTIEEMAEHYLELGDYDEALDAYKEILRGNLEKYGYEHISVGSTLQAIASVQMKRKHYEKAVQSSQKAVHVRKLVLGEEHPDVAVSLVQLGLGYFQKAEYNSALKSFEDALKIRRKYFGSRHPTVAKVLNNKGATLCKLQTNGEALLSFKESLNIQREVLQSCSYAESELSREAVNRLSLSIASSLSNICTVKLALGLVDEALVALEEALEIQSSILGEDHPEVEETRNGITFINKTKAKREISEQSEFPDCDEENDTTALIPSMLAQFQQTGNAIDLSSDITRLVV